MTFIFNPQCAMIVIRTHAKYKVLISHAVQKLKSDRRKETDNTRPIVLPLRLTRSVIILRNTKLCANSTELHFIKEISAQWFTSEGLFYDCSHKRLAVPYTTMHVLGIYMYTVGLPVALHHFVHLINTICLWQRISHKLT